ncbi:MAG TPA: hypothetical protein VHN74_09070 [Candidatus Angelobacter sp.]|jgi:hypothetical protein|nr:hypothetical protein [Candidatus Angelobacter sp.]
MLWTIFMLVMFGWMLATLFQFRVGAMPLLIVLAAIMASIKILTRFRLQVR